MKNKSTISFYGSSQLKVSHMLLLGLFFIVQSVSAQSAEKIIFGRIVADSTAVEKVNILNARNEKSAVTDKEGNFRMSVQIGDDLVITAVNLESRRKTITESDLQAEIVFIKMNIKMNPLKEVNVNDNSHINSDNLGITSDQQKKYTPAEKKLYTANSGLLDPLLNKISGRTAMLKKEVAVERNEKLLVKLDGLYEEKYYTEVLKIPQDYIKGFQYYLIEDPDYAKALVAKNKTMTMFLIKRLAVNYNEIILKEQQSVTD